MENAKTTRARLPVLPCRRILAHGCGGKYCAMLVNAKLRSRRKIFNENDASHHFQKKQVLVPPHTFQLLW